MRLYVEKEECNKLQDVEDNIDIIRNIVYYMSVNCKSMIVGHDIQSEYREIEYYLKIASQKTQKLKLAMEKELERN
ncbi:hypothetical protein JW813_09410 [Clostridium botulinum]|uniref:hypothetical protein n=1 Tax=Clostridium botulinum TaxID=1491 RepID=UPI0022486179|nr:hypothetical protein [Clostridium botulinum]UZP01955.1 hypothetical protein JW813_09410 [Clostridium botulinum]UZP05313.1 hypothetical protein JYA71_09680 [Clostridium botulinum]UZP08694.1 hypothetical protein JYA74_09405 [Clostridium botulinum]